MAEDDARDLEFTLLALSSLSLRNPLEVVRDGVEALNYLAAAAKAATCPAIALMDLKLPRASGHDVLRASRGDLGFCQMPIVVVSSSARSDDVAQAYDLGANAYVVKPLGFSEFLDAITTTVKFWLGRNVPPPCALASNI